MRASFKNSCCWSLLPVAGAVLVLSATTTSSRAAGPAYSWTGCYGGAEFGAATSTSRWRFTNNNPYSATMDTGPQSVPGAVFDNDRGVAGGQVGCNRAISDFWLVGIEASWFSNPMNKEKNNSGFFPAPADPQFNYQEIITTNIQSVTSVTGRLGIASSPDWLVYGKGGVAAARIETAGRVSPVLSPPVFDFSTTAWHFGWTAGAGVEYRLFRNVTLGVEYDYYSFGNVTHSGRTAVVDGTTLIPANTVDHRVNADVQTLMLRLNFGLDTPEYAGAGPYAAYAAYLKAPPAPVQPVGAFSAFVTEELKYSSFNGTRGPNVFAPDRGSGYQVYSPTTIGVDYVLPSQYKLETRIKSGYVYTSQETPGQFAHYEGPVDTQASFNLTLLNFDSIRPLLGVALNLPTGNSFLPGNQRFTRADPDLVDAGSYGAGFNVNPTAGFIIGLNESTAVSFSGGYAFQGDFNKEGVSLGLTPNGLFQLDRTDLRNHIDPGDTYTANGNISSTFGSLVLIGSFAYMGESRTTIDGVASGKSGAKFTANGTANYGFDDQRTALSINVSWNFAEKNEIPNGFGGLTTELKNSNSNVYIGSFEPSYLITDRLKIAANYSFLYRDRNFYSFLEDQFIPAKQKHLVGASLTYALTPSTSITLRGSHAWIEQDDGPLLVTTLMPPPPGFALQPPELKYEVTAASVAATMRF